MAHLLEVRDLSVRFHTARGIVDAVRGVGWHLDRGETLAILGESGSGKSVSASAIMNLIDCPPGEIVSGEILFDGRDLLKASPAERRAINGRRIAMIFQDPLSHLNPVYSVGWQLEEVMRVHGLTRGEAEERALELMRRVGIPEPARRARQVPAPVLRRPAPAGDDRHGAGDEARHRHRRRADDRARRHRAGRGAEAARGAAGGDGHRARAHHPRPRRRRRGRRPGGGDERGRGRRGRHALRDLPPRQAPLHPQADRRRPRPRRDERPGRPRRADPEGRGRQQDLRHLPRARRGQLRAAEGRGAGRRRRVGLGQVDGRQGGPAAGRGRRGTRALEGPRPLHHARARAPRDAPRHPDGVPGPDPVA